MKIAILGSGDVGQVLGAGFAALGHEVKLGTRDPRAEKIQAWVKKTGAKASAGTFDEAAKVCELAVLATKWDGTESALKLAGADNLAGKILIDATNPLAVGPAGPSLAIGHKDSGGEQVQRWAPKAKVVKAFNTVGNAHMFKPSFPGGKPDMFIAGNDDAARKTVTGILSDFGWNTVDLGSIEASRYLEPMAMAWVVHGFRSGGWNHAFALLRK